MNDSPLGFFLLCVFLPFMVPAFITGYLARPRLERALISLREFSTQVRLLVKSWRE